MGTKIFILFSVCWICFFLQDVHAEAGRTFDHGIEINEDKILLGGKELFINAIGYAGWRPGQWPGTDKVDIHLMEMDFKRIKEAGFNTIRTWDALTPTELELARRYDLKVIQGIWLAPNRDISDKYYQAYALDYIRRVVQWTKVYDNVLFYLVMTEPHMEAVLYGGVNGSLDFFRKIKETIQGIDNRPVSMDSWLPLGFLDHSLWDIAVFNVFMFTPESINRTVGFAGQVAWMKRTHAAHKPLIIGETGGFSVSPQTLNSIGFGGNTQEQQSRGDVQSVKEALQNGATGVVTVSWLDTWHYPNDPNRHDAHPWEWDGFVGFDSLNDQYGTVRKVFHDFQEQHKQFSLFLQGWKKRRDSPLKVETISTLKFKIMWQDKPLGLYPVDVGFFLPTGWLEKVSAYRTDKEGVVVVNNPLQPLGGEQYLIVGIGIQHAGQRYGDIQFFKIHAPDAADRKSRDIFRIYTDKDFPGDHFFPSGWVGDYKDLTYNDEFVSASFSRATCIEIKYSPRHSSEQKWAGIYWQNEVNNWWDGGRAYDLSGFHQLIFWAKGKKGGEIIFEVGFGGKRPNTADKTYGPIQLTKEWQQYTVDLSSADLSAIIHGFHVFFQQVSCPEGCTVYLDDIALIHR